MPESWLVFEGEGATVVRDFDATELDVRVGDRLEHEHRESGWLLARDPSSRRGWVPLECVRLLT